MDEPIWISVHAFYHGDMDRLLLQAVQPLTEDLATSELVSEFFFLRYWEGGPHLRLRVLAGEGKSRPEIQRMVTGRLEEYLAKSPAVDTMTQPQYSSIAPSLADREKLAQYDRRLHPNNSLSFIPYRREYERYGHGASIRAVERNFGESSRIALDLLASDMPSGLRATVGVAVILLSWFSALPEPGNLSAALGRLRHHHPDSIMALGQAGKAPCAEIPHGRMLELADQMRTLTARAGLSGAGPLVRWARSAVALRNALSSSNFPELRTLAILDTCGHLTCNRLGISLGQEAFLRNIAIIAITSLSAEGD